MLDGSSPQSSVAPRKDTRVILNAEVALRRAGRGGYRVNVHDLSCRGAKLDFVEQPRCSDRVWIKIEGLAPLGAVVKWVDGFVAGVEFDEAIHPAVFARVTARLR